MLSPAHAREMVTKAVHRLLLIDAEKVAAARSATQQLEISRYFEAAMRRCLAADALTEPSDAVGSIILYRESIVLFVASLARIAGDETAPPASGARTLEALKGMRGTPIVDDAAFEVLKSLFDDTDPLALDALPSDALQRLRGAAQEAVASLRSRIDPRPPPALRRARRARVGVAVVLALALLGFVATRAVAAKNIARGKVTTASSRFPGTPPASGATNGEIESSYGVHTQAEVDAWVMVDLGALHSLREVRVYSRGDGWQDEGLPIDLELSADGRGWLEIDRRTMPYSQALPWITKIHAPPARYVRLRRPVRGVVAISEIEVYE